MQRWGSLITAMVTPFDEELNVNYGGAVELAKQLVEEGTTALTVCGTTGEAPTLTTDEKIKLFKEIKASVDVPVIAGIGTNSTKATIEMGRMAVECGVDGVLVVVPYYNKPNQEGIYRHFKAVAEEVKLPIMMYNVPGRTGGNMDAETVIELSRVENIVALKEASGNLSQVCEVIRRAKEGFNVYSGDDFLTIPIMAMGGAGVVSVASQVVGPMMRRMIDSFLEGDVKNAAQLHNKLKPIFDALFITTNPIPVKKALNLMGRNAGGLRLPMVDAGAYVEKILVEEMVKLGLL
ncbi:MAG: 4-hydroxy-tetrahydrodipicolinate synthase [Bacillota bacterium]|nr:4-hydroxy-tetrahydrodipicolinate synthase [Bacillota bacterium]